jgi:hypothetical protein
MRPAPTRRTGGDGSARSRMLRWRASRAMVVSMLKIQASPSLVIVGSLMTGISALRHRLLAAWLAWLFVLVGPSAVVVTLTLLPTTPSGGLWMFSMMMIAVGYCLRSGCAIRDCSGA